MEPAELKPTKPPTLDDSVATVFPEAELLLMSPWLRPIKPPIPEDKFPAVTVPRAVLLLTLPQF